MNKLSPAVCVLALCGSACAHVGVDYYAPRVPDPESMRIDGSDEDWAWFDSRHAMTMDGLDAGSGIFSRRGKAAASIDPEDYAVSYMAAWSPPPDNRFYFFARIQDNHLDLPDDDPDQWWAGDYLQITFDADHSGGPFLGTTKEHLRNGQRYMIRLKPPPGLPMVFYGTIYKNGLTDFVEENAELYRWSSSLFEGETTDWFEAAWTLDPPDADDGSRDVAYTFEFSCALWDTYGMSAEESVRHLLEEGQVIHVGPRPGDADGTSEKYLLVQTGGTIFQDREADNMVDYHLVEDFSGFGVIAGLITNPEDGSPWSNIEVAVENGEGHSRAHARSNEEGRYQINLPADAYTVKILHAQDEERVSVDLAAGARIDTVNFSPTLEFSSTPKWPFNTAIIVLGLAFFALLIPLFRRTELIGSLLRAPGQALQQISEKPDQVGPICIILASAVLIALVIFGQMFLEMGRDVPQERFMIIGGIFALGMMLMVMLVGSLVAWVVQSAVVWGLARMSGESAGFTRVLSIVGYALLPEALLGQVVLGAAIGLGMIEVSMKDLSSFSMPTSLTVLIPGLVGDGDLFRHLFDRIEVFALWTVVLMAVGLRRLCAITMRKAAAIIAIFWVLETAVVIGFFALMNLMKDLMTS